MKAPDEEEEDEEEEEEEEEEEAKGQGRCAENPCGPNGPTSGGAMSTIRRHVAGEEGRFVRPPGPF